MQPFLKENYDRGLESVSIPYKLAMRILLFFDELCSSIRSRDSHREGGIINPFLLKNIKLKKELDGRPGWISNPCKYHLSTFFSILSIMQEVRAENAHWKCTLKTALRNFPTSGPAIGILVNYERRQLGMMIKTKKLKVLNYQVTLLARNN